MEVKDFKRRELEKFYVNVFIFEEETYLRVKEEIKKQKIYIFIGLNLKGYKEIISVIIPEEETSGFWMKEIMDLKQRGLDEIFMIAMINNKWIDKTVKMVYPNVIYTPSMIEIYNKTYNYIKRVDHRIIMRELNHIYKAKDKEEAKQIYDNLKELYKENKLMNLVIDKYIDEIFEMFKYSRQARIITSNTDGYNKLRNRIRWKIKKKDLFEDKNELNDFIYDILFTEEQRWNPSVKRWDTIINEMECNLSEKILELI